MFGNRLFICVVGILISQTPSHSSSYDDFAKNQYHSSSTRPTGQYVRRKKILNAVAGYKPDVQQQFGAGNYALMPFWSAWSSWGECRDGIQKRVRRCSKIAGFTCPGVGQQTMFCTDKSKMRPTYGLNKGPKSTPYQIKRTMPSYQIAPDNTPYGEPSYSSVYQRKPRAYQAPTYGDPAYLEIVGSHTPPKSHQLYQMPQVVSYPSPIFQHSYAMPHVATHRTLPTVSTSYRPETYSTRRTNYPPHGQTFNRYRNIAAAAAAAASRYQAPVHGTSAYGTHLPSYQKGTTYLDKMYQLYGPQPYGAPSIRPHHINQSPMLTYSNIPRPRQSTTFEYANEPYPTYIPTKPNPIVVIPSPHTPIVSFNGPTVPISSHDPGDPWPQPGNFFLKHLHFPHLPPYDGTPQKYFHIQHVPNFLGSSNNNFRYPRIPQYIRGPKYSYKPYQSHASRNVRRRDVTSDEDDTAIPNESPMGWDGNQKSGPMTRRGTTLTSDTEHQLTGDYKGSTFTQESDELGFGEGAGTENFMADNLHESQRVLEESARFRDRSYYNSVSELTGENWPSRNNFTRLLNDGGSLATVRKAVPEKQSQRRKPITLAKAVFQQANVMDNEKSRRLVRSWTSWSPWSPCNCGMRVRARYCITMNDGDVVPAYFCHGSEGQQLTCNTGRCKRM